MKVLEAIGKGFAVTGRNIGLLAVVFIFNAVWNLATLPFFGVMQLQANVKPTPQFIILTAVFILANIFIQGGVLGVLKDNIVSGGKPVLGNFTKYGIGLYLKLLGLGAVLISAIAAVTLILIAVFAAGTVVKNIIISIIMASVGLLLIIIALYYLFLFFLAPYTLVVDNTGIFKALGNSFKFVKARLWKLTGLTTLLVLIGLGMGFAAGICVGLISLAVKGTVFQVVGGLVSSAINAYVTVLIGAALIVYYHFASNAGQQKEAEVLSA